MLQISASAQTVLLFKVAVGRVWDAEPAENAPALVVRRRQLRLGGRFGRIGFVAGLTADSVLN